LVSTAHAIVLSGGSAFGLAACDGFARAIFPAHQQVDGDAVVTVATGEVDAPLDWVRSLATLAVSRAISSLA
jgi:L-aminopeptidase/D-esterase-like protein